MTRPHPPAVFVYGALRSGTTLFRLMLNSHDGIANPGEADFLFDFLAPPVPGLTDWRYDLPAMRRHRIFRDRGVTLTPGLDGLPLLDDMIRQMADDATRRLTLNVHRHADRIAAALPQARFIHLLRDPRDVARSSVGMGWTGSSYHGIEHWIDTEQAWDRALAAGTITPDRVLEVRFESLLTDIGAELHRVCAFLGVGFSEAMLSYHQATSYGPPDPAMIEQWRRHAGRREVARIEGRCGPLLAARGYRPAGAPVHPGPVERGLILASDRLSRLVFNIRRFGLPLVVTANLSRRLGLRAIHARARARMDEKLIKALK